MPDDERIERLELEVKVLIANNKGLKDKIEELKREKETNQQMIYLAETQILGYGQGYKDGLNKKTTVTEIVARERENQIIYEGMKHKINMQWVLKIKAKIEEIENEDKKYKNYLKDGRENFTPEYVWARPVLQSLLENDSGYYNESNASVLLKLVKLDNLYSTNYEDDKMYNLDKEIGDK